MTSNDGHNCATAHMGYGLYFYQTDLNVTKSTAQNLVKSVNLIKHLSER